MITNVPTRTLRRALRAIQRKVTATRCRRLPPGGYLHIGCGNTRLAGWINVDKFRTPAVDYVLDIRFGLPFANLSFVFAEHFLEHLSYSEGNRFLRDCRAALGPAGVLRLSTPNLDWVYATQYHPGGWASDDEAVRDCFWINKSFRGWGHQFLYNLPTLSAVLRDVGFGRIETAAYGASTHEPLIGLERHEQWTDEVDRPHVLIVEASGYATQPSNHAAGYATDYQTALTAR